MRAVHHSLHVGGHMSVSDYTSGSRTGNGMLAGLATSSGRVQAMRWGALVVVPVAFWAGVVALVF